MSPKVFKVTRYNIVLNENQRKKLVDIIEDFRDLMNHGESRSLGQVLIQLKDAKPIEGDKP